MLMLINVVNRRDEGFFIFLTWQALTDLRIPESGRSWDQEEEYAPAVTAGDLPIGKVAGT
jgi:hypothetical protein